MVLRILLAALLATSALAQNKPSVVPDYKRVTGKQRFNWFVVSTVGPPSLLLSGPISAAWGTAFNKPPEYGPHWEGFGKRYGIRLTGVSTGNAIEASLGAVWGEDALFPFAGPRVRITREVRDPHHIHGSRT